VPAVPPALDQLVAAMLSKSAADRPQTMRQVAEQLGAPATTTGPVRASAAPPSPAAPAPARTPMQPALTTLRGTASEIRLEDDADLTVPRRRAGLVVAAVAVVVLAAGGVWAWRRLAATGTSANPGPDPVVESPPAPPSAPAPIEAAARAASPPPGKLAVKPSEPATVHAPTPGRSRRSRSRIAAATSPPAPQAPVRVEVQTDPPGAGVCLQGDGRLIGRTPHVFSLPRDGRRWTLLLQLPGFRLKEVPVKADRDLVRSVKLDPLGADDLAPVAACR
jgi:hypothetical protein